MLLKDWLKQSHTMSNLDSPLKDLQTSGGTSHVVMDLCHHQSATFLCLDDLRTLGSLKYPLFGAKETKTKTMDFSMIFYDFLADFSGFPMIFWLEVHGFRKSNFCWATVCLLGEGVQVPFHCGAIVLSPGWSEVCVCSWGVERDIYVHPSKFFFFFARMYLSATW